MSTPNNKTTGATAVGHNSVFSAITTAIIDLFGNKRHFPPLKDSERLDGKVCLVTGANTGLGKAIAIQLAQRGGHVIMACRSGIPEAGEEVKKASGSDKVTMLPVNLADLHSVNALCDKLRDLKLTLDIVVLNAGLMPLNARRSTQGYELMFAVHFLANRLFMQRCIADGIINATTNNHDNDSNNKTIPRVILVSSEAHQSSEPINFDHFGYFVDYGLKDGIKHYGLSKLHTSTFAHELSRRLNPNNKVNVSVFSLCPGPVASNIAREAPAFLKPILTPIISLFFRKPETAAEPILYLACADAMANRTGIYLHMMREKLASDLARDTNNGKLLWEKSAVLIQDFI